MIPPPIFFSSFLLSFLPFFLSFILSHRHPLQTLGVRSLHSTLAIYIALQMCFFFRVMMSYSHLLQHCFFTAVLFVFLFFAIDTVPALLLRWF